MLVSSDTSRRGRLHWIVLGIEKSIPKKRGHEVRDRESAFKSYASASERMTDEMVLSMTLTWLVGVSNPWPVANAGTLCTHMIRYGCSKLARILGTKAKQIGIIGDFFGDPIWES